MNAGMLTLISHTAIILSCLARPGIAEDARPQGEGLPDVVCAAEQTGGFHDYPGAGETYEPALFHPRTFTLEENLVFKDSLVAFRGGFSYRFLTHHAMSVGYYAIVDDGRRWGWQSVYGSAYMYMACRF